VDPPHGCRQPQRSRRYPGAAVRRTHRRGGGAGRNVGQHAARAQAGRVSASHHSPAAASTDASIQELGTLGGAVSQAKAVNPRGDVVGTSRDSVGRSRAFLWKQGSGIVDLRPSTGVNSSANDINEQGDIVGGGDTGFAAFHAYLLSEGTSGDLGTLGTASIALGINNRSEIVGGSGRAFLWSEQAGIVDLGTLGGRTSCANDINDLGCIVGVSQTGAADRRGLPVTHAFLRTPDGTMVDLGTLGGEHSSAAAVSEEAGGTIWIAGHSHDASAHLCAVRWAVRLRS